MFYIQSYTNPEVHPGLCNPNYNQIYLTSSTSFCELQFFDQQ